MGGDTLTWPVSKAKKRKFSRLRQGLRPDEPSESVEAAVDEQTPTISPVIETPKKSKAQTELSKKAKSTWPEEMTSIEEDVYNDTLRSSMSSSLAPPSYSRTSPQAPPLYNDPEDQHQPEAADPQENEGLQAVQHTSKTAGTSCFDGLGSVSEDKEFGRQTEGRISKLEEELSACKAANSDLRTQLADAQNLIKELQAKIGTPSPIAPSALLQ